jgi:hypothetical protein
MGRAQLQIHWYILHARYRIDPAGVVKFSTTSINYRVVRSVGWCLMNENSAIIKETYFWLVESIFYGHGPVLLQSYSRKAPESADRTHVEVKPKDMGRAQLQIRWYILYACYRIDPAGVVKFSTTSINYRVVWSVGWCLMDENSDIIKETYFWLVESVFYGHGPVLLQSYSRRLVVVVANFSCFFGVINDPITLFQKKQSRNFFLDKRG